MAPTLPIFFVQIPSTAETSGLTEADRNEMMKHGQLNFTTENGASVTNLNLKKSESIVDQLNSLGMKSIFKQCSNP